MITETTAQVQQIRDLLECVWPAVIETARQPFKSHTWTAGLSIVVERDGGDLAALTDPAGVLAHRTEALERVALLLEDWTHAKRRLADDETRMTSVLDELKLAELVTSIPGLSSVGAAAIPAQTGDPRRFAIARALGKHAGLAPREKLSGKFKGRTKLTGQGRPGLRLAAWRAVWGAQRANPVYAAR